MTSQGMKRLATEAEKFILSPVQRGAVEMIRRNVDAVLSRPTLALEIKMVLDYAILHGELLNPEFDPETECVDCERFFGPGNGCRC